MLSYIIGTNLSPFTTLYYYLIAFNFIRPIAILNSYLASRPILGSRDILAAIF